MSAEDVLILEPFVIAILAFCNVILVRRCKAQRTELRSVWSSLLGWRTHAEVATNGLYSAHCELVSGNADRARELIKSTLSEVDHPPHEHA
jgi:hypothetical protein